MYIPYVLASLSSKIYLERFQVFLLWGTIKIVLYNNYWLIFTLIHKYNANQCRFVCLCVFHFWNSQNRIGLVRNPTQFCEVLGVFGQIVFQAIFNLNPTVNQPKAPNTSNQIPNSTLWIHGNTYISVAKSKLKMTHG